MVKVSFENLLWKSEEEELSRKKMIAWRGRPRAAPEKLG
jgi:hypothetical protein